MSVPHNDASAECSKKPVSGFALVIALSLMAFVVLLLLSLGSFITVETKTNETTKQIETAKLNAYLGLQVALGELQKHTGSDTRITANAAILDTDPTTAQADGLEHPHWTGVWARNPATGERTLLSWLVSGNESLQPTSAQFLTPQANQLNANNSVVLVDEGTTGPNTPQERVTVKIQPTSNGSYAYWVSDEQSKAKINLANDPAVANATTGFPQTIASQFQFPHMNLTTGASLTPEEVNQASSLDQVSMALGLDPQQQELLKGYFHDLTVASEALFTDALDGGLKVDLSALLSGALPPGYDQQPIYQAPQAIVNDPWATQLPTWNYLKSFYDLRLDVLADGKLTPNPGTANTHAVSPIIAMFKYGFGGGLDFDNRLLVNLYPMLVLYNPYNVTLAGRDYGLIYFGNQLTRDEAGGALIEFMYLPVAQGVLHEDFHSAGANYEMGKAFTFSSDSASRTDIEGIGDSPVINPPGAPRFEVKCPDIPPGAAVVFTPSVRKTFDRFADENPSLTPGFRELKSFVWYTILYLVDSGDPSNLDKVKWSNYVFGNLPVYLDAALVDDLGVADMMKSAPGHSHGVQKFLYRRNDSAFYDHVFQLTGRIPLRESRYSYPSATYYYGFANPNPGVQFAWGAYASLPNTANDANTRPFLNFNPRAKDLDPSNIANGDGDFGHYFYNTYGGVDFPSMQFYDGDEKVYFGGGFTRSTGGSKSFVLYDVPSDSTGLYSLGQLQHMKVSDHFDEPGYAIGNSWASPHIARDAVYRQGQGIVSGYDFGTGDEDIYIGDMDYSKVDLSYLLNEALWDKYFFSTIDNIGSDGDVTFHEPANPRYRFCSQTGDGKFDAPVANASQMYIDGAFNVNSTSVNAWQALLSSLHGITLPGIKDVPLDYPFSRFLNPAADSNDPWAGFRELTGPQQDDQIHQLALAIVEEVKRRGPFTSLAQFVNRQLVPSAGDTDQLGLRGTLQAAIDKTTINQNTPGSQVTDSNTIGFLEKNHAEGMTGDGIAGFLTQADILTAIGPLITVRSDTFLIRSYGDATNPLTGEVESRAWCEAVVQRLPEYVNRNENAAQDAPASLSPTNQLYGRRYKIVSFRWIDSDEV